MQEIVPLFLTLAWSNEIWFTGVYIVQTKFYELEFNFRIMHTEVHIEVHIELLNTRFSIFL